MNFIRYARLQWDRVSAVITVIAGALVIILGWIGVSQAALTAQQLPYVISGGIGGLFLLGVGGVLWLSADLRDEWRKLDAIEDLTRQQLEVAASEVADDPFLHANAELSESGAPTNGAAARRARPLRAASVTR